MGPLAALVTAYDQRRQWTLDMPHLGLPGCERHNADPATFPEPILVEPNRQTKEPMILSVETITDGERKVHMLKSPCSYHEGRKLTHELVMAGVHPLDILVATWEKDRNDFTFRNAVDHLFWTYADQRAIEIGR